MQEGSACGAAECIKCTMAADHGFEGILPYAAGGKGGPQFMNIEDVLKQTKGMEGDAAGGAADSEFADGLDEHDEL